MLAKNYLNERKKLHKSKHHKQFVIMTKSVNGPVFLKWNEIEDYITPSLYRMYNIWYKFHMGFGMPGNKAWDEQPLHIMDIIETFEKEYRSMRA